MKIPTNTWVVVADGQKAIFLQNTGTAIKPVLHLIEKDELENPPTREQGTDRPGRYPSGGAAMSAVEQTDWHEFEKTRFAHEVGERLNRATQAGTLSDLVLVAPARALGELRNTLSPAVSALLRAEIEKDLTNHPVDAILALLDDFER